MPIVILTPEERTMYEGRLADANMAYHSLMTGTQARVVVDQNGERVEFTSANRAALYNYILGLQSILGIVPIAMQVPSGPAGFIF